MASTDLVPLVSVGVDHKTAPVEIREALAFNPDQARRFLAEDTAGLPERLLISTCNRTALLAVAPADAGDPVDLLSRLLRDARGVDDVGHASVTRVDRGEDVLRHLFRVATGIESMVLGESQILGQIKDAAEIARGVGATGPVLSRALETAVRVAKQARSKTSIGEGAVSVASSAVELAKRVYGDLSGRSALVVGAGETGALVSRHLRQAGIGKLTVANRTLGRAEELAGEVGAEPWGLCGVPVGIREADIVVTSTGAENPILTADEVRAAMKVRKDRMLLVLDIAVPRDVDPAASKIENVFLHDVDALRTIVDANLDLRRKAIPRVEAMVEEAVASFVRWEKEMQVTPAIKALRERFEEIRQEELAKNLKRIPEEGREATVRLTESLMNRLLHEPTVTLRREARNPGGGRDLVAALRRLFGMGGRK
ncbi:MAG: glutamyl-tRNA reductase [Planctomycetota bacterium]